MFSCAVPTSEPTAVPTSSPTPVDKIVLTIACRNLVGNDQGGGVDPLVAVYMVPNTTDASILLFQGQTEVIASTTDPDFSKTVTVILPSGSTVGLAFFAFDDDFTGQISIANL